MFWKSKGNWKKPTKAGKSNEKPKRKTNEVMQAPVKPSLGVGKERKVVIKEEVLDAPKPVTMKPVDPMPKSSPVEEKVEEVEIVEEAEEEKSESEPEVVAVDMNLSRKKLSEIAKSKGISVSKRMSKQDIIDAILEN